MYKTYYNQLIPDTIEEPAYNKPMIQAMERWILECKLNLTPYNDGWSLSHYKKELEKAEKIYKSWGTQLEISFPNE